MFSTISGDNAELTTDVGSLRRTMARFFNTEEITEEFAACFATGDSEADQTDMSDEQVVVENISVSDPKRISKLLEEVILYFNNTACWGEVELARRLLKKVDDHLNFRE